MEESTHGNYGIETIGVNPIPLNERVMTPGKIFIFWSMASASALTPIIAYLLSNLGFIFFIVVLSIAFFVGLVPAGIFSGMGRKIPAPALVVSRKTYGYATSSVFSIIFTFVNLGWFGLNDVTGGLIIGSVTNTNPDIWFFFMAIFQIVIVIFGAKYLEKFYRYTSVILVASYSILAYFLFSSYKLHFSIIMFPASSFSWGSSIGLVLAFSIMAWAYKVSTITRFAKSSNDDEKNASKIKYFIASPAGIMLPVFLMGSLGFFSLAETGNWNIAAVHFNQLGSLAGSISIAASVGAALAIIHTNSMNLYPATADLLSAIQALFGKSGSRFAQPVSTIILGLSGAFLAYFGILNAAENFLNISGSIIFPFTFILIIDWFYSRRYDQPLKSFYEVPGTVRGNVSFSALVATVTGIFLNVYPLPWLNWLFLYMPQILFGSIISAIIFYVLLRIHVSKPDSNGEENAMH